MIKSSATVNSILNLLVHNPVLNCVPGRKDFADFQSNNWWILFLLISAQVVCAPYFRCRGRRKKTNGGK